MQKILTTSRYGFTLIELLIVVAIIAILAVSVIVALNPPVRFAQSRNAHRVSHINSILTAIHEYAVDNDGALPAGITTTEKQLGSCASGGNTICTDAAATCVDLSTTLSPYLKTMPIDPKSGSAATTYYSVAADANNIVTVKACNAEDGEVLQVSR